MVDTVMWMRNGRIGGGVLIGLCMLAMLVLAVLAIIWLARQLRNGSRPGAGAPEFRVGPPPMPVAGPNPLQVLDERLARGEIDAADYETRRALLLKTQGG